MLKVSNIVLDTTNFKEMSDFYKAYIGKDPDMFEEGNMAGWFMGDFMLCVGLHSEATGKAKEPVRIMINFEAADMNAEYERIKQIPGVTVVKELYEMEEMPGMWIATFADPDGNYIQIMPHWEDK